MQPVLVHYCTDCAYNTPVPYTASVFSQIHSCSHCGTSSQGVNIRPEQDEGANMQQEELARLFSANLSLSQNPSPQYAQQAPVEQPQQQQQEPAAAATPITYVSQHYTHSYHVAPARQPPVPERTVIDSQELEAILQRNSIDPTLLFPSQIDLFQNADDDQRLRLLELWRISPPTGRQGYPSGVDYNTSRQLYDWPPTSLAQEEAMAKLRYEKDMEAKGPSGAIAIHEEQQDMSMDQGSDSAAVQAAQNLLATSPEARNAEPYIVSGYDMLARREYDESAKAAASHLQESSRYNQATDPVYNGGGTAGMWNKNVGSYLDMENQYGAFAHAREYDVQHTYGDEEMVM